MIKTNRLPSEYQEVEYISSNGGQYIDTGFIPDNNTSVEVKFKATNTNDNGWVFGAREAADTKCFAVILHRGSYSYPQDIRSDYGTSTPLNYNSGINLTNNIVTVLKDKNVVYVNGVQRLTHTAQAFTCPVNLYLFKINSANGGNHNSYTTMYYAKIWDNGTLIRYYIPCYRKSDNAIGMYDLVNNTFAEGVGTFTKGNDVGQHTVKKIMTKVDNSMKEIEYIEIKHNMTPREVAIATFDFDGDDACLRYNPTIGDPPLSWPARLTFTPFGFVLQHGVRYKITLGNVSSSYYMSIRSAVGDTTDLDFSPTEITSYPTLKEGTIFSGWINTDYIFTADTNVNNVLLIVFKRSDEKNMTDEDKEIILSNVKITSTAKVYDKLPSGYQRYDYVWLPQSSGSSREPRVGRTSGALMALKQYSNLDELSYEIEFEDKIVYPSNYNVNLIGGRSYSGVTNSLAFYLNGRYVGMVHLHGLEIFTNLSYALNTRYRVKYTNTASSPSYISIGANSEDLVWSNTVSIPNTRLHLFANPTPSDLSSMSNLVMPTVRVKIGKVKIYDLNGNLINKYIPCIRKSDNQIGMYDIIEGIFYTTYQARYATLGNTNCIYEVGNW